MNVWVTRSEPGASRLVTALQDANIQAKKCSAIQIIDRTPQRPMAENPDVCLVVSQHAATRYANSEFYRANTLHIAIGNASRAALGQDARVPMDATTEGILKLPELADSAKVIWLVSGVGGREDLEQALTERDHNVTKLEFYERQTAPMVDFVPEPNDIIEVSSVTALEAVASALNSDERKELIILLVPSERIAQAARDRKFYNTQIASSAEIADVVAAAKKMQSAGRG